MTRELRQDERHWVTQERQQQQEGREEKEREGSMDAWMHGWRVEEARAREREREREASAKLGTV